MALSKLVNGALTIMKLMAMEDSTITLPMYLEHIIGYLVHFNQDGNVMTIKDMDCRLLLAIFGRSLFVRNDLSWGGFPSGPSDKNFIITMFLIMKDVIHFCSSLSHI